MSDALTGFDLLIKITITVAFITGIAFSFGMYYLISWIF